MNEVEGFVLEYQIVKSQPSFHRVKIFYIHHNFSPIALKSLFKIEGIYRDTKEGYEGIIQTTISMLRYGFLNNNMLCN